MRKMISILVRNHAGVLSHVAGLFTRRAYNIESIAAGETEDPGITRIFIEVSGEDAVLEQVTKQLRKLVDVIKVQELDFASSVTRELVLMTIYAGMNQRQDVIGVANGFGAEVVDIANKTITLEFIGSQRRVNTIIHALEAYRVKDLVRTGVVGLPLESQLDHKNT